MTAPRLLFPAMIRARTFTLAALLGAGAASGPLIGSPPARAAESKIESKGKSADLPAPETFDDFDDAVAHARKEGKHIVIAALKSGDVPSFKLGQLLKANALFLSAANIAVFEYKVDDDAKLTSFKSHFNVAGAGIPVVVIADSSGKPLASKTGLLNEEEYVAFVKEVAGEDAIEIPPEGMFGVKKDDLVGSVDLTETRNWMTVTGRRFTGALVEANGSMGIFRTPDGREIKVGFNDLSPKDVAFLEKVKVLKGGSVTFPGTEGN